MADRPLSIDIRHPLLSKANDLVLLTREDGEIVQSIPGFGLFYRDTCYFSSYALCLHGTVPLLLMASDGEGMAAQMNLTNSHLATANGQVIANHKLSLRRNFLVLDDGPVFCPNDEGASPLPGYQGRPRHHGATWQNPA